MSDRSRARWSRGRRAWRLPIHGVLPNDPFEAKKHEVLDAMLESPAGDSVPDADSSGYGSRTDDDQERWWSLVTAAQHVEIERAPVLRGVRVGQADSASFADQREGGNGACIEIE